ncbi:glutamate--cysteine ligase [Glaciecola sp. XM2]|uniref:glutamate--cysteine ligase n=1 Tax=Glaciecola sp. XM2 TaxID=1914931 RepID=UPI001BDEFDD8|nr:glutamate--cysteine ligase [Glaciecola sp. XM2]MBT1450905.1 glutamate--cysteine ligase [Glaciecola sp. XM2]
MSIFNTQFEKRLSFVDTAAVKATLMDIRRGVERETLRVNGNGSLAMGAHPKALGSSLTHDWITTDFSESLLEFITPPEQRASTTIEQLIDIHKFTYENIGEEYLWPMSMPCFIDASTEIPIARYGSSNVAKMKEVYRRGLHNRYGSMMQVISGVHFNFSLPDRFWQLWCEHQGQQADKHTISSQYFSLVRNFKRLAWVIPYLFGASPALCSSFISHREVKHPFQKVGKGTLYLPYGTSLRMSDLGYTSSAQSDLRICYNDLSSYVSTLRRAINLPTKQYESIPAGEGGQWQQLNKNVLQIENELYSPIRPKQVARSLEKPTDALEDRGVSYLEIRSLDVNPFSPVGIQAEQMDFLDVFLLYCLLMPSADYSDELHQESQQNFVDVVLKGREPGLHLLNEGAPVALQDWASNMFKDLAMVADVLDAAQETKRYSTAIVNELAKVHQSETTPSGKWLDTLLDNQIDNSILGMELAKEYKQFIAGLDYRNVQKSDFEAQAVSSLEAQAEIEAADVLSFDKFIEGYFKAAKS